MGKSIAIYSRKSKFTGKGESIENQIELCRQYVEATYQKEAPLELIIYEDEGYSGKNTARPQFKRMMEDAGRKRFSVIVCYRLDRISRNVGDFAKMIDELNRMGIAFVSIREAFDTSTPMGRAMMYIACVFAQLERETIAERIRDNMYELSKTGRWLGGTTPTGYLSEEVEEVSAEGKAKKVYRLKLHPEEATLVRTIFRKYIETGSLTGTDAFLLQNHYYTKNKVSFSRYTIRNILTNPVYMIADEEAYQYFRGKNLYLYAEHEEFDGRHGVMAYNRTKQTHGKAHIERDMEEWVVTVGKHEGIISGKDFVKVQQLLEQNRSKSYKKPRSHEALLSGLLYCDNCKSHMRPKLTRRRTIEGARIYDYLCTMKEKSKGQGCQMKNPKGNLLDLKVCQALTALPEDTEEYRKEVLALCKSLRDRMGTAEGEEDRCLRLLAEIEKEIQALVRALAASGESPAKSYIIRQVEELHEKGNLIREQLAEVRRKAGEETLSEEKRELVRRALADFDAALRYAPTEHKRRAINSLVKRLVWDGDKLHVYLKAYPISSPAPSGENSK
jgi:site-specific DNA recombinase